MRQPWHVYPANTHTSADVLNLQQSLTGLFSIPCTNYIELHQYLTSVLLTEKLISGLLSFHLPENTSTHQPLSVVTFLSTSLKRTSPSITITQQKRLCAESNYIRRAAGSDKQAERSDSWSDWWLFITHATENKSKSNRRRKNGSLVRKRWFFKEPLTEWFFVEPKMVLLWHRLKNIWSTFIFKSEWGLWLITLPLQTERKQVNKKIEYKIWW